MRSPHDGRRGSSFYASLPWYDLEETRPATDELWRHLSDRLRRRGLRGVPRHLERQTSHVRQWHSGRLLFGQSCGYDVVLPFRDALQVLGTPRYTVAGCRGCCHRSLVVVHEHSAVRRLQDLRGSHCIINEVMSHSGMNALRALVAHHHRGGRFFAGVRVSGSHTASLALVRQRLADVAAIDCVTFGLLQRHRPGALDGVRVLCETPPVPAPPFVTRRAAPPELVAGLRQALIETLADPALAAVKDCLMLDGVEFMEPDAYRPIAELARRASEAGYFEFPRAGFTPPSGGPAAQT